MSSKQEISNVLTNSAKMLLNKVSLSDDFKAECLVNIQQTVNAINDEIVHYHQAIKMMDAAIAQLKDQISKEKKRRSLA